MKQVLKVWSFMSFIHHIKWNIDQQIKYWIYMTGGCGVLDTLFLISFSAKTIKLGLAPDDYLDFVKEDAQLR